MGQAATMLVSQHAITAVIASPNADFRKQCLEALKLPQHSAEEVGGGAEALEKVAAGTCRMLILDRWLPDLDVTELCAMVRSRHPQVEVLVVDSDNRASRTNESNFSSAQLDEALQLLQNQRECPPLSERREESASLPAEKSTTRWVDPLPEMIGSSQVMQRVYRLARLVAPRTTTVLLTGETGTGKELVARAIHQLSRRARHAFVTVNCAAIPESLLEAELFGYARGAFTGAFQSTSGRIQSAHGGTLFLDEVGELPPSTQAKLLRFLQEGEVQRLGGSDIVRVDVRVIAATNADLAKRVREKAFREDLYYRIAVFPVELVPLRERLEDILPLGAFFLDSFCQECGLSGKAISSAARKSLEQHRWPGNVRELRHVMERAFILSEDDCEILPEHISLPAPCR